MLMSEYVLNDFMRTVPSCVQTTSLALVLEIFSLGNCDRLVVLNEQQNPLGVITLQRLMPIVMTRRDLDVQQPLSALDVGVVEPIATLPANLKVEQFRANLTCQQLQPNSDYNWALVDADGKFAGLVDYTGLLQFLALSPVAIAHSQSESNELAAINENSVGLVLNSIVCLLEQMPWPLMIQTDSGEVVTQNPAWQQQFGLSNLEELLNVYIQSQLEVNSQSDNQQDTCICTLPKQNGQEQVWQFVKITLESEIALPLTDKVSILLANDVTEQQQLAAELVAKNADLIGLNRLKDEFLACISHELKTPITTVMGLSTLLKNQDLGQLNERQARYAGLIHQRSRHLMSVVNNIFDLTSMETGQIVLTLEPVQIKAVCDHAIKQARATQLKTSQSSLEDTLAESATDPQLTLLIEPELDIIVADELRLRQMLVHLLSNAFKFTAEGGKIGLRVSRWEGWIAFTVWDTGIGIPEQQQHLVFQKFQQLENPLTRQFEGTGLGLVLTRSLARLHGGDVSFLSTEGKGSSFTVLLPPSPPPKKAEKTKGQEDNISACLSTPIIQNQRNRLVLIVEAAPRFIENLTEQLTNLGYRFAIARSGTEALEKARRLQPGTIFLNPLLPLLSGWDVLTLLKSDAATSNIPIVVTATRAEKDQTFANQADEFLSLPVEKQALQKVLTRFCPISPIPKSNSNAAKTAKETPLTILRLVNFHSLSLNPASLAQHQVLEADDLEQAELIAKVWQPDVVLLDEPISEPIAYLKKLSQYSSLKNLPIVTLDVSTTQAANQVTGLAIFPCLTSAEKLDAALLPVLQIAAGKSCKASILVVDVATLNDSQLTSPESPSFPPKFYSSKGSEWFQALIQYLDTAGFIGVMAHSWAEVLQKINQQSIDLLLICLGNSKLDPSVVAAIKILEQQYVPPVLILEQHLSQRERHDSPLGDGQECASSSDAVESLKSVSEAIADNPLSENELTDAYTTQILPHSLSMAELLDQIHQTLARSTRFLYKKDQ
jgi:signal transduction histidine kinase/CheY-like chemotaxis protein